MSDEPTCGKGLAAHAALPRKLAAVVAATAENLEEHMPSIDRSDPAGEREHAVYERLAAGHWSAEAHLRGLADEMAAQHDLPMARHDMEALGSPAVAGALERLVAVEAELVELLQTQLEQHRAMLGAP